MWKTCSKGVSDLADFSCQQVGHKSIHEDSTNWASFNRSVRLAFHKFTAVITTALFFKIILYLITEQRSSSCFLK